MDTGSRGPPSSLFTGNSSCREDASADTRLAIEKKSPAKPASASQLNRPFTNSSQEPRLFSAVDLNHQSESDPISSILFNIDLMLFEVWLVVNRLGFVLL